MSETPSIETLQQELTALRSELIRARALADLLMKDNPDGIAIADKDAKLSYNAAAQAIMGTGVAEAAASDEWASAYGLFLPDGKTPYPTEQIPMVRALGGETVRDALMFCRNEPRPEGFWLSVTARPLEGGGGIVVLRDITERRALEERLEVRNQELAARAAENQQLIDRLRVAVDELSTPVLEVWDDILALPVVGVVDTQRSAQMVERLLAEVVQRRSRFVIVDLTGVDVIDTSTADRFLKLARAVELLGAECIVTGMQPAVAQTLIELGVELAGINTQRNLKRALQVCMAKSLRTARLAGTAA